MLITVDTDSDRFSRQVAAMLEMAVFSSGETRTGDPGIDKAEDELFKAAMATTRAWRTHDLGAVVIDHKDVFIKAVMGWTGYKKAGEILDASILILNYSKPDGAPEVKSKDDFTEKLFVAGTKQINRLDNDGETFEKKFIPV